MHYAIRGQQTVWPPAFALSLALHAGVLMVLAQSKWTRTPTSVRSEPLVVYLFDRLLPVDSGATAEQTLPTEPVNELEREYFEPAETVDDREPVLADNGGESGGDPDVDTAAEPPAPLRPAVDWQEEARRAAVRIREQQARADAYVTFGNPFTEEAPTSLNSSEGQRLDERQLPPERSSFGEMILSLGDGCYHISGGGSILVEQAFSFSDYKLVGRVECPRPIGPRNDLFSEQKPDYLK